MLAELEGGDDGAASSSPAPAEEQPQQSQQVWCSCVHVRIMPHLKAIVSTPLS